MAGGVLKQHLVPTALFDHGATGVRGQMSSGGPLADRLVMTACWDFLGAMDNSILVYWLRCFRVTSRFDIQSQGACAGLSGDPPTGNNYFLALLAAVSQELTQGTAPKTRSTALKTQLIVVMFIGS